jgi:hypothetical protein
MALQKFLFVSDAVIEHSSVCSDIEYSLKYEKVSENYLRTN